MAHDTTLRAQAERLYVDEYQDLATISRQLSVPAPTLYRWAREGGWGEAREAVAGMRDKLGRLILSMIDEARQAAAAGEKVEAQRLHAMVNLYDKYLKTSTVREKIVYVQDAETLFEAMKKVASLRPLLEDREILSELGTLLKENAH